MLDTLRLRKVTEAIRRKASEKVSIMEQDLDLVVHKISEKWVDDSLAKHWLLFYVLYYQEDKVSIRDGFKVDIFLHYY